MKAKSIRVKGMNCGIHLPCEVEVSLLTDDINHVELITGAFEGYLNSIGCTMCAAESIDTDIETYVGIFIDKFIPIISTLDIKAKINLVNLKPLSYG
tara:strand:+ start:17 stop:307 length:291 start_codon:yes stop_codon:yes gene_type:complete